MMTDAERQEWAPTMRKRDAEIACAGAETATARREMRFPPGVAAAIVLGLLTPNLTALIPAN